MRKNYQENIKMHCSQRRHFDVSRAAKSLQSKKARSSRRTSLIEDFLYSAKTMEAEIQKGQVDLEIGINQTPGVPCKAGFSSSRYSMILSASSSFARPSAEGEASRGVWSSRSISGVSNHCSAWRASISICRISICRIAASRSRLRQESSSVASVPVTSPGER